MNETEGTGECQEIISLSGQLRLSPDDRDSESNEDQQKEIGERFPAPQASSLVLAIRARIREYDDRIFKEQHDIKVLRQAIQYDKNRTKILTESNNIMKENVTLNTKYYDRIKVLGNRLLQSNLTIEKYLASLKIKMKKRERDSAKLSGQLKGHLDKMQQKWEMCYENLKSKPQFQELYKLRATLKELKAAHKIKEDKVKEIKLKLQGIIRYEEFEFKSYNEIVIKIAQAKTETLQHEKDAKAIKIKINDLENMQIDVEENIPTAEPNVEDNFEEIQPQYDDPMTIGIEDATVIVEPANEIMQNLEETDVLMSNAEEDTSVSSSISQSTVFSQVHPMVTTPQNLQTSVPLEAQETVHQITKETLANVSSTNPIEICAGSHIPSTPNTANTWVFPRISLHPSPALNNRPPLFSTATMTPGAPPTPKPNAWAFSRISIDPSPARNPLPVFSTAQTTPVAPPAMPNCWTFPRISLDPLPVLRNQQPTSLVSGTSVIPSPAFQFDPPTPVATKNQQQPFRPASAAPVVTENLAEPSPAFQFEPTTPVVTRSQQPLFGAAAATVPGVTGTSAEPSPVFQFEPPTPIATRSQQPLFGAATTTTTLASETSAEPSPAFNFAPRTPNIARSKQTLFGFNLGLSDTESTFSGFSNSLATETPTSVSETSSQQSQAAQNGSRNAPSYESSFLLQPNTTRTQQPQSLFGAGDAFNFGSVKPTETQQTSIYFSNNFLQNPPQKSSDTFAKGIFDFGGNQPGKESEKAPNQSFSFLNF